MSTPLTSVGGVFTPGRAALPAADGAARPIRGDLLPVSFGVLLRFYATACAVFFFDKGKWHTLQRSALYLDFAWSYLVK